MTQVPAHAFPSSGSQTRVFGFLRAEKDEFRLAPANEVPSSGSHLLPKTQVPARTSSNLPSSGSHLVDKIRVPARSTGSGSRIPEFRLALVIKKIYVHQIVAGVIHTPILLLTFNLYYKRKTVADSVSRCDRTSRRFLVRLRKIVPLRNAHPAGAPASRWADWHIGPSIGPHPCHPLVLAEGQACLRNLQTIQTMDATFFYGRKVRSPENCGPGKGKK